MRYQVKQKKKVQDSLRKALIGLLKGFDQDGDGTLNVQELHHAYQHSEEFRHVLGRFNLTMGDIDELLMMADVNGDGDVNYGELVYQLMKVKGADPNSLIAQLRRLLQE